MNIGLTYTGSEEKHANYLRWLKAGEKGVDIITLSVETKENKGVIEDCDALVLSGGLDIHPGYYNSNNFVYPNMPQQFYEKRDAFEKSVLATALERKIPVLGVCRGLQLINCVMGGSLQQDLAAKNSIHKAVVTDAKQQFDKAHGLHITEGSLLQEIAGTTRAVINSAHHQCVSTVAPDLQVNCLSDDNVIEGLEWKDKTGKSFLLCIQWHPERMFQFQLEESALAKGIRNRFISAIKK
ncbi:MAG TPA: gamma-glutamyl-gamma-aminobutyrate hydrolase family protein [Chitinophagaceae bacterium]|nr:gamma-glutamyl-gamma-aminobutyrate hydrolase family protein [Chitinophagaceae bacterium]